MSKKMYVKANDTSSFVVYPVEYIESDGHQYLNTEICVNANTKFEADFQYTNITSPVNGWLAGTYNNAQRYYPLQLSSKIKFRSGKPDNYNLFEVSSDTNRHTLIYNDTGGKTYYDGVYKGTLPTISQSSNQPLFLFSASDGAEKNEGMRLFSCKISNNSTQEVYRDFIPVRTQNNVYGLYDKVSGKFFADNGTGFLGGEDLTAEPYAATLNDILNNGELRTVSGWTLHNRYTITENVDGCCTRIVISNPGSATAPVSQIFDTIEGTGEATQVLYCQAKVRGKSGNVSYPRVYIRYIDENSSAPYINLSAIDGSSASQWNDDNWHILSLYCNTSNHGYDRMAFGISEGMNAGDQMDIKEVWVVNLTKVFGKGKEPNKTWCDNYLNIKEKTQKYYTLDALFLADIRYVDTGVKAGPLTRVVMDFKPDAVKVQNRFFSTGNDASHKGTFLSCYINASNNFAYAYNQDSGNWKQAGDGVRVVAGTRYTIDLDGKNKTFSIGNGATLSETLAYTTLPIEYSTQNILIGSDSYYRANTSNVQDNDMYLYSCKIYDNDALIRDFIPIEFEQYHFEDDRFGLLDRVTNTFYPVEGFGSHIRYTNIEKMNRTSGLIDFTGVRPIKQMFGSSSGGIVNNLIDFTKSTIPGTFIDNNGSHTISSTYNGFSLVGRANANGDVTKYIKWTMPINTNQYKRITFLAQMTKPHGNIWGGLYDGTNFYQLFSAGALDYHTIRTGDSAQIYWKKYDVDLSGFSGNYTLWFCGGRPDNTGNTDSATSYRDITLIGAKEIKKAYINVAGANLLVDINGRNYGGLEQTPNQVWTVPGTTTFYKKTAIEPPYSFTTITNTDTESTGSSYRFLYYYSIPMSNSKYNYVNGVTNKYYLRAEVKNTNITTSTGFGAYFYLYTAKDASRVGAGVRATTLNKWTVASKIQNISGEPIIRIAAYGAILSSATENGEEGYIRNMGVYNLTAMFGPGNEPSQAWCDENFVYEQPYGDSTNLIVHGAKDITWTTLPAIESRATTNYINTSLCMPYGFRATGKLMFTELAESTWQQIMGSQTNKDPYQTNAFRIDNNGHFALGESESELTAAINTDYTFDFSTRIMNSYLKINNSTIISSHRHSNNANYISNYPIYIFSVNNAGSAYQGVKMKLYWLKIYDAGNNLIADYVPIQMSSSETAVALFDKVTQQILLPGGTLYAVEGTTGTITSSIKSGVPRLTFERDRVIEFDQTADQNNILPTTWNQISSIKINDVYDYEAYSPLGWWGVRASSQYSSYIPSNAVDNSATTYWRASAITAGEWAYWYISCPQPICPLQLIIKHRYMGSTVTNYTSLTGKVWGFNVDTHQWEQLATLTKSSSSQEETINLTSTNSFYTGFRIDTTRYSSNYPSGYLYNFAISKGKILLTPGLDGGQAGYQMFTDT